MPEHASVKHKSALGNILVLLLVITGVLVVHAFSGHHSWSSTVLAPNMVQTQADGLELSLRVTPGPYFLSELVPVDVSLTNRTHTTIELWGSDGSINGCNSAFSVSTEGGNAPHYRLPWDGKETSCAPPLLQQLAPGETLSARNSLLLLRDSGDIILTASVSFKESNPFKEPWPSQVVHWPRIQITVDPKVPAKYVLSPRIEGTHLSVAAPTEIQSSLVFQYLLDCGSFGGSNDEWTPLPVQGKDLTRCAGTYAVGAPGYATATISYPPS